MSKVGTVFLVGAGPGDPGLLTLNGLRCLQQADLVLYDGLVNPLLLRHTSANAERTARRETPSGRTLDQQEINRRLIEAARAGKTVVRLKGGDPFVFGRGSEEAAALAEAGIPFEVVPGITAATAAGAYAGISVTHREMASAVMFVTGHEDPAKSSSSIDYEALAKFQGTLVFYMGLHRLENITNSPLEQGKSADTPTAVISRATTPAQQVVTDTLGNIAQSVQTTGLLPPSLIIIGECARQRERIAWYEKRPLFGQRIGLLRAVGQTSETIERGLELGAQPVLLPTIKIQPPEDFEAVDEAIATLNNYSWIIFTSVNGVTGLFNRIWETGDDIRKLARVKLAAIGPATAAALEDYHLRADLIPSEYRGESLAEALKPHVVGQRILWARASRGRDVIPEQLQAAGATVDEVVVYQNLDVEKYSTEELDILERGEIDWIVLSSPSIARNFSRLLTSQAREHLGTKIRIASISPVTSEVARKADLPVHVEAIEYHWDGIFQAIIEAEHQQD